MYTCLITDEEHPGGDTQYMVTDMKPCHHSGIPYNR